MIRAFREFQDIPLGDSQMLEQLPALVEPVQALLRDEEDAESPAMLAAAIELIFEGLHLAKRLNKDSLGARAQFRGR